MGVPVFLSRTEPHTQPQARFLELVCRYLRKRGLEPRTIGETDFGMDGLAAVRGLLRQSNGLISIAFRRAAITRGVDRPSPDASLGNKLHETTLDGAWLTTPWCHMETAMAYQIGLPILLLVEEGVRQDGALENGVLGQYPPLFQLGSRSSSLDALFDENAEKWRQLVGTWEGQVREVVHHRARPPALYGEGA